MFVSCMDRHATRKLKRIKSGPRGLLDQGLLLKMHGKDLIKKKAISSNDLDM